MASTLTHTRRRVVAQHADALSDARLLERFAASRDEAAFEVLVWRHGPMVLGVCRRALGNHHDAEDAVQATFLALARQAGSISRGTSLAAWLHQVAHRTALRARQRARKQPVTSLPAEDLPAPPVADPVAEQELCHTLDEELQRLPEKYRVPLILSYLQGLTNREVAGQLGCPLGTVFTRLARGRDLLRSRLKRRGQALGAAGALHDTALPACLARTTAHAAAAFAAGQPAASASVLALAEEALKSTSSRPLRTALALVLLLGAAGAGLLATAIPARAPRPPAPQAAAAPPGDPLPEGVVARLVDSRFRHAGLSEYVCLKDNKTVLTAGSDRVLRFWDLASGRQVRAVTLQGKAGPGKLITLSPDGKTLTAEDRGKLVFWEVETGKEIKSLPAPKGNLAFLWFSPDGQTLAAGTWNMQVHLLKWRAGKERRLALPPRPHGMDSTYHACFSPDGKYLAAGGGMGQALDVYDTATVGLVHRFRCNAASSIFTPDSKRLLVSCMPDDHRKPDAVLRLFDLAGGQEIKRYPLGSNDTYFSLAFSPDGKRLTCSRSDVGLVLDTANGRVLHRLDGWSMSLSFTPDGKTLLGSFGPQLRVWDAATGRERHPQTADFGTDLITASSPDGSLLAAVGWGERSVALWDLPRGRLLRRLPLKGEKRYTRHLSFSGDGKVLVAAHAMGLFQFWDAATGRELRTVQLDDLEAPRNDTAYFYHLQLSADGKYGSGLQRMFTRGGNPTRLGLWDTATGKFLHQHLLPGVVRHGVWPADGKSVVLALPAGVTFMDIATGKVRYRVEDTAGPPLAGSPDERLFAAPRKGGAAVVVHETATGQEIATLPVRNVAHLALAPDNRTLVTTDEQFFRVWDLATLKERVRRPLPVAVTDAWGRTFVRHLALTPDGRRAFTALADGTALLWDVPAPPPLPPIALKEIAACWADLAAADARRAYAAVWRLGGADPERLVPFLGKHLRLAPVDRKGIRKHIADLDSESFAVRERAFAALQKLGPAAVPELRLALEKKPSLEVHNRLQRLLERSTGLPSPEGLRRLRALQVLERIDSREGRRVLAELARGPAHDPQTAAAKRALERLVWR